MLYRIFGGLFFLFTALAIFGVETSKLLVGIVALVASVALFAGQ